MVIAVVALGLSLVACAETEPDRVSAVATTSTAAATPSSSSPPPESPTSSASVPTHVPVSEPLAKLAGLSIKGRAPKTGYDRRLFGQAWSDDVAVPGGRNGCDTRNDILRRDLVDVELKPGSNGCAVLAGTLHDPYSGKTVKFRRGPDTSPEVQIDHTLSATHTHRFDVFPVLGVDAMPLTVSVQ
ncbi:hypothetical protein ACAG25_19495 [Mycobacterium sp. pV006]|uniref:hypothetical protein n=1 Tax=Mycobacterium sp. pV006 TaxID=3238983 RepID=UPI00351AE88F